MGTFNVLTVNALYAPQTNTGEPHITSMMFAHAGLQKRLVLYLVPRGTLWTLKSTYKYQIWFTHVKVMFLATYVQAVFFILSRPNICITTEVSELCVVMCKNVHI